jgi:hypothetical protein
MYTARITILDQSITDHLSASTASELNTAIENQINQLVQRTHLALNKSCLVLSVVLLLTVTLLQISPYTIVCLVVMISTYLKYTPLRLNPVVEARLVWWSKNAWIREYDRVNAPDAQIRSR